MCGYASSVGTFYLGTISSTWGYTACWQERETLLEKPRLCAPMAKSVREALAIVRHRPKEGWQVGGKKTSGQREGRKPVEKGPLPLQLDSGRLPLGYELVWDEGVVTSV